MPLIVGLTGLAGSGKSTLANYLKKYGFEIFALSDILRREANKKGLLGGKGSEEQKEILALFGDKLRRESGDKGIVAEMLIKELRMKIAERILIDGFRSVEEVQTFKNNFRKFYLIFVDTRPDVRLKRKNIEDPKVEEKKFFNRDKMDIENKGLKETIKLADFRIDNNGNFENLKNQADIILRRII